VAVLLPKQAESDATIAPVTSSLKLCRMIIFSVLIL